MCVYARNAAGVENTVDYVCVPAPTTTNTSAILSWTLGTDSNLAGYKVYVGTASGTYNYPGSPFTLGKLNTYTVNNLPIGQTYFFAVSAVNTAGNDSALSAEVSKSIY
jgi:Fibronectin type III domain